MSDSHEESQDIFTPANVSSNQPNQERESLLSAFQNFTTLEQTLLMHLPAHRNSIQPDPRITSQPEPASSSRLLGPESLSSPIESTAPPPPRQPSPIPNSASNPPPPAPDPFVSVGPPQAEAAGGAAPPPQQQEQQPAAAAAQQRLDVSEAMTAFLWENGPYITLLVAVFLYQHLFGILLFVALMSTLYHLDGALKKQAALMESPHMRTLGMICLGAVLNTWALYALTSTHQLWRYLAFLGPPPPSSASQQQQQQGEGEGTLLLAAAASLPFLDTIWAVCCNDVVIRYAAVVAKCGATAAMHSSPLAIKQRSRVYAAIEAFSSLLRCVLPANLWYRYLASLDMDAGPVVTSLVVGVYLTMKLKAVVSRVLSLKSTCTAMFSNAPAFGKYASAEEVAELGNFCSICHESDIRQPVVVRCNHVFCEDCITSWMDRDNTCPLCRQPIASQSAAGRPRHSDGSTSLSVQLF